MKLRISALIERLRASLFFVPMLAVFGAVVGGFIALAADRHLDTGAADLPLGFSSTVDSARAVLGVIAGATISFAGIAFSVSLLVIQLASSQYSPRVLHTLFRDPFNKRVMALVVGTFTYCIVVLRSVRTALDSGGEPVIPNISVAIAVVLGIASILAIVAFIDHSAHTMDVSEVLDRIRSETNEQIQREWTSAEPGGTDGRIPPAAEGPCAIVRTERAGWIQQIDTDAILAALPDGATARVGTYPGRYAIEQSQLIAISPEIDTADLEAALREAFVIGETRTMQQDVSYGLRQLVDVTVKALSPSVNDPTTAQDAIFHTVAVLSELLRHDPPPAVIDDGSRRVVMSEQHSHAELIRIAYDEPRRAAATLPSVCVYLLTSIESLVETLGAAGLESRTDELHRQARLIVEGCGKTGVLDEDVDVVRAAYVSKFETG